MKTNLPKNEQEDKNNKLKRPTKAEEEMVDETIEESFPASDSPAWYAGKDKVKKTPR